MPIPDPFGEGFELPEVPEAEVPTPLEACEATFEGGVVSDVSSQLEEALAGSGLPDDLVAQLVEEASAFDLTCADLFGGGAPE